MRTFIFVIFFAGAIGASAAAGETRRAVLVGIDEYQVETPREEKEASAESRPSRGNWTDLDGAVNDADAMTEILVHRFGFARENVRVLRNREATHAAILDAIRSHLVMPAQRGDVSVFFYAGHGSRVRDSRSPKEQRDQSIVPVDAASGGWDIADKELHALFNDALDKGVLITAVFDSCHSGAMARGFEAGKIRMVDPDERDYAERLGAYWKDGRAPPWTRGLFLEAATAEQLAREGRDEHGRPHGAFSLALVRALSTLPVNTSAQDVFTAVKGQVVSISDQLPQLEATAERKRQPLFGTAGEAQRLRVAVRRVDGDGKVELLGGQALGLEEGCELRKVAAADAPNPVRLRVDNVSGLGSSSASVLTGSAKDVAPGDQFEIERWSTRLARLRVWKAPALEADVLAKVLTDIDRARADQPPGMTWIDDPTTTAPTHLAWWDGTTWKLAGPRGEAVSLGATLQADALRRELKEFAEPKLFVNVPPAKPLAARLEEAIGQGGAVVPAARREEADYLLAGRLAPAGSPPGRGEYALVRRDIALGDQRRSSLPIRTDWMSGDDASGGRLTERMMGLARVNAWLRLQSPPDATPFPYRLVLRRAGKDVGPEDTLSKGDEITMVLRADPPRLAEPIAPRWVYVLALDEWGKSTLLYPPGGGGGLNRLPTREQSANPPSDMPLLDGRFTIAEPLGMDTYIMLASAEEIPDPSVLEQQGVRTREPVRGYSPLGLAALLGDLGTNTRGADRTTPTNWSLQRFAVRSKEQ